MLPHQLGLEPFRPRAPWWTGDLQTLRDTLRPVRLPADAGQPLLLPVAARPGGKGVDQLLAVHDLPLPPREPLGLVVLLHGLGGSSDREGLRRMGRALQLAGFAVLRLNLRGAGAGRALAPGTYAACCNRDLLPVLEQARHLAHQHADQRAGALRLLGMGISLGGTMLLNAALAGAPLDGLVCISSPLDLAQCSAQIERPRNRLYQRWLLKRLVQQTLADPFGVSDAERVALEGRGQQGPIRTIRGFDAAITAPRWGYSSVEHYYAAASPWPRLLERCCAGWQGLPPTLLVHAYDDPWVPVEATRQLAAAGELQARGLEVLLTRQGGHNGFHSRCDGPEGNWGDRLTARWFRRLVGAPPQPGAAG
ncbi:MAG: alpha/beta fold hydrolase [Synechococcaceae bacterium WB8_1B_136]|nr:alpha/beta fold hydrolase [Synechococcaceae bacterium WB8_1B_136]